MDQIARIFLPKLDQVAPEPGLDPDGPDFIPPLLERPVDPGEPVGSGGGGTDDAEWQKELWADKPWKGRK